MRHNSQETLRRVTQDDPSLTELSLINSIYVDEGEFHSDNSDDYSTLGAAIANNTHLETLAVILSDDLPLGVVDRGFYEGLKSNSSICNLGLHCNNRSIAGVVGQEILKVYQKNGNLRTLGINTANLQNGGDRVIVDSLRSCRNLQNVVINYCSITDEQLLPIVDAVRGHRMLEVLGLLGNNIENAGCDAIATLLIDPNSNLEHLYLGNNAMTNEGATSIANSLTNNIKLEYLFLDNNPIDQSVGDVFSNLLCNATSIEQTYLSNHTLGNLSLPHDHGQNLQSLLGLNRNGNNESHVSIKKILKFHRNIDMEPLFEWGLEEDDEERTLKALPYIVDWFEKAKVAVAEEDETYHIEEKKLSAIFQFAKAMPLMLEGIARYDTHESGGSDNKGK